MARVEFWQLWHCCGRGDGGIGGAAVVAAVVDHLQQAQGEKGGRFSTSASPKRLLDGRLGIDVLACVY